MPGHSILLADDSPTVLGMISYALGSAGFSVTTAGDGIAALRAAYLRPPDLVLMDIRMPRIDGIQACRYLKYDPGTRDVPVLLLASREAGSERGLAVRAGADRCLTKEVSPEEIVEACTDCLAGRPPRSGNGGNVTETGPPDDIEILIRVNRLLEAKLSETTLCNEIGKIGWEVDDFETTLRGIGRIFSEIVPHDAMLAVFSDGISLETAIVYPHAAGETIRRKTRETAERLWRDAGLSAAAGRSGVVEFLHDRKRPGGEPSAERYRPVCSYSIRSGDMVRGVVALFSDGTAERGGEESFLQTPAHHAFVVMQNAWLYRQIARISVTDGLTGLTNHRHFLECLKKEHVRSSRYRLAYSVLMADIDHFKKINDVYGHPVGDTVLRELSALIREQCRSTDHPARYGGEEFVVLLPETTGRDASVVAERIRAAVERKMFAAPSHLVSMTVSIGISSFDPETPLSEREVIQHADEALYTAKREGRNRVCAR
jgi:diguanylate cyclase (GGDEF)-like protein